VSPGASPLSVATLSATETAEMRRGWVHSSLQAWPCSQAWSSRYCGTWVVLPQPVSPLMRTTWLPETASRICCLHQGSLSYSVTNGHHPRMVTNGHHPHTVTNGHHPHTVTNSQHLHTVTNGHQPLAVLHETVLWCSSVM